MSNGIARYYVKVENVFSRLYQYFFICKRWEEWKEKNKECHKVDFFFFRKLNVTLRSFSKGTWLNKVEFNY